jgi:pSer/pThr/pTyr-binding forkhead associated (FHA) protein
MAHADRDAEAIQSAERRGDPFLVYRDAHGRLQVLSLPDTWDAATIGRGSRATVILAWDEEVSRVHAELKRVGDDWTLVDDGLSRNGTFVNGERISRRRRLRDGDELLLGDTLIRFHAPFQALDETAVARRPPPST